MTLRPSVCRAVIVAGLTLAAGRLVAAQDHPEQYAAADVAAGSRIYHAMCVSCHGPNGAAVGHVDLRRGPLPHGATDSALAAIITSGIPASGMPAFPLDPAQLKVLVAFIRVGFDAGSPDTAATPGDGGRGRAFFEGRGNCLSCHRVNDKGQYSGPDLTDVGRLRTPAALQRSLIDPTGSMLPINRPVRAVTRDGTVINGRRLNEDSFTVQLVDDRGRLVSLVKGDLRKWDVSDTSPMPSYKDTLTAEELADVVAYLVSLKGSVAAQVPAQRLRRASDEPQNWLTYSGTYSGQRYSLLRQIDPTNVKNLEMKWILQAQVFGSWESSPLVVDGIMYLTQRPNDVLAVDARTGRIFWIYKYAGSADYKVCCGANNRGLAILGDTLFMGTLDGHLVALDARNGRLQWNVNVAEFALGYSVSLAPLVVKDKVIIGVGGGEYGIRGFIAAYDAATGKEAWRFNTIPGPGEPGSETWGGDSWRSGGGAVWVTGSYDPDLNLTYWGVGNPGPDFNPAQRPGDNLYTDAVVALDADTGQLRWHFQFTPADRYDYDATQVPVLVDAVWRGAPAKLLMLANRNGFFYVLDRVTGVFLSGKPFVKVNWASGLDEKGRPIETPQPAGATTWPGQQGGTNWYSPSYSPRTGLFYIPAWEDFGGVFRSQESEYQPGKNFMGGSYRSTPPVPDAAVPPNIRRGPINTWTNAASHGAVVAIDPNTGARKWTFPMYDLTDAGILTTASDLLFTGGREGYFHALDARTGALLWKSNLGSTQIYSAPITYQVDGKQYVSIICGNILVSYALRD